GDRGGTAPESHRLPPLAVACSCRLWRTAGCPSTTNPPSSPSVVDRGRRQPLLSAFILTTSTSPPMTAADACPGILDLHEARDGHVARIRLPGGYATSRRLRGLAA